MSKELEYTDSSHAVTAEEALNNLVAAVILNGVLEYRRLLIANLELTPEGYAIHQSSGIKELENFFKLIGFAPYTKLSSGVISFQREIDKDVNRASFKCPICGGQVRSKVVKSKSKFFTATKRHYSCEGCLIHMSQPIPEKKGT